MQTSSTTSLPAADAAFGPVRISVTPTTLLSGATVTVAYATTDDGTPLGGRWQRRAWASWDACAGSVCHQVAWLRLGAHPVDLPGEPTDRAYLPYDHPEQAHPDGPDRFEIPSNADGAYRLCATLHAVPDGVETTACAPVTVLHVPPAVRPGDPPGWFEIDPANPPTPDGTTLHVLVHTVLCERPATVKDPEIIAGDTEVAIRIPVAPVDCGGATPPGGPTPATVTLPSPLGDRVLLDALCLDPLAPATACTAAPRGQRWPHP